MHLLYCDETNLQERSDDFFVYGGLIIEAKAAAAFSETIEKVRLTAGISPQFTLKFNPGPAGMDHASFTAVKQSIIEAACASGCILTTSMILHNIASSPDDARRNAINQLSYNFNSYLCSQRDHGLVLIDRFSDSQIDSHLRDKFSIGVTGLPYSPTIRLHQILGFHYSAIGQSHFGSAIDIILGSLRYAVNAFTRQEEGKMASAQELLRLLGPLFQKTAYKNESGQPWVTDMSLYFSPRQIRSDRFRHQYSQLRVFLARNGLMAEQEIT